MARVKGSTVTLSAPATDAASAATVPRKIFTQGSRHDSIRSEVTAWSRIPRIACGAPHVSATRPHSFRAALSLAIDRKRLELVEKVKAI